MLNKNSRRIEDEQIENRKGERRGTGEGCEGLKGEKGEGEKA